MALSVMYEWFIATLSVQVTFIQVGVLGAYEAGYDVALFVWLGGLGSGV